MRRIIDKELVDPKNWPGISTEGMAESAALAASRRVGAMRAYLEGASMADIFLRFRLGKTKVLRLFKRCIARHEDGRIHGFRACIPYARCLGKYKRLKAFDLRRNHGAGASGLMSALFDRYPQILEEILDRALQNRSQNFAESGLRLDRLHARFIALCRLAGIKQNEYPFCTANLGERSFKTHVKREMLKRNLRASVAVVHGDEAARKLGTSSSSPRIGKVRQCMERVEVDAHRLDSLLVEKIKILDPRGGEPLVLPLERIWLLVVIDVCSRAVLGYHISLERHYTSEDLLCCLENALRPWVPRTLTIPGLVYPQGAGLPSGVIPELAYAKWGELAYDNDKSHLSKWVFERVQQQIGCAINPGPIQTPESRQFVERFFRSFEAAGFQRLPTTTGRNVDDPRRRDPAAKALRHHVSLSEVEELVDVLVATYNATPTSALHGRSPLEYLRFAVENNSFFIRTIPERERQDFCLTIKTCVVNVRGYLQQGVRPFVELFGVRYYGERLGSSPHLIGEKLHIELKTRDLRTVRAFLSNGEEFDLLTAAREWAGRAHDLKTRQNIRRYVRKRRLEAREMPDPIEAYIEFKKNEKKRPKKANNEIVRVARRIETILPIPVPPQISENRSSPATRKVAKNHNFSRVFITGVNY